MIEMFFKIHKYCNENFRRFYDLLLNILTTNQQNQSDWLSFGKNQQTLNINERTPYIA